jgi:hypothetical protein
MKFNLILIILIINCSKIATDNTVCVKLINSKDSSIRVRNIPDYDDQVLIINGVSYYSINLEVKPKESITICNVLGYIGIMAQDKFMEFRIFDDYRRRLKKIFSDIDATLPVVLYGETEKFAIINFIDNKYLHFLF